MSGNCSLVDLWLIILVQAFRDIRPSPLVFVTKGEDVGGGRPFRFNYMAEHESFGHMVKEIRSARCNSL